MKVVILAGGLGTRLSEETTLKPKPMVEIGGYPILWHIMKTYSSYGFHEFIICAGYKSYVIKDYFYHYYMHSADMTIDMENNKMTYHNSDSEPWKVTIVDTGMNTMTGARIKCVQKYIGNEPFMLTYGDGVSNENITDLIKYHVAHKKIVTITAVQPSGKFGSLELNSSDAICSFQEKPKGDGAWINAGYMVLQPEIFQYLSDDENCIFERTPLENIAKKGQLQAYKHTGFWKPMDTLRDKGELNDFWNTGKAPWKVWK
ncbi:MAG: glucose-1-phosphate cytidylyltransferase [Lentisphaeria bacterium]